MSEQTDTLRAMEIRIGIAERNLKAALMFAQKAEAIASVDALTGALVNCEDAKDPNGILSAELRQLIEENG